MLNNLIKEKAIEALNALFQTTFTEKDFQVNTTKPEFKGDYTIVLFSLIKPLKLSPDALGNQLGEKLIEVNPDLFTSFNIIKGFLNLEINPAVLIGLLNKHYQDSCYGKASMNGKKVMVEYSSPNTNKPLHLGHLRNNFLGWSISEILKANGYDVIKSCIVNDRGIHICKSMIAWQRYANGATPASATGAVNDSIPLSAGLGFLDTNGYQAVINIMDYSTTNKHILKTYFEQTDLSMDTIF
jgi:arginyl-tRNA synthetase